MIGPANRPGVIAVMSHTVVRGAPSCPLHRLGLLPDSVVFGALLMSRREAAAMIAADQSAPVIVTNAKGESGYYWLAVSRLRCNGQVTGYRFIADEVAGLMYDVAPDLAACECKEWLHRRPKLGCKHCRAIRALRELELIP